MNIVVLVLGLSRHIVGPDLSLVRKISRVRAGLGPSRPATCLSYKLTCEPSAQVR